MQILERRRALACAIAILGLGTAAVSRSAETGTDKIPITTSSEEARKLYLQGRDLFEKLRAADARTYFEQAVAKDKTFALAHLSLANTAPSAKAFFDSAKEAMALAPKVSEGERLQIEAFDAGVKGNVAQQKGDLTKLATLYPKDERVQNALGGFYFGQQDYPSAIEAYKKATTLNPSFSQPYNQLGYAYRFTGKYAEAEQTFKKYTELIPDDPNPYDSYAELLMKMGRHDESIKNYEKALSLDKNFVASYIGISNNQMFTGKGAEARTTLGRLKAVARNDGERRLAHLWTAVSYVYEGDTDKALAEVEQMLAIAEKGGDLAAASGDQNLMGDILLEAGQPDKATPFYQKTVETIEKANVPVEVKEATRRNLLYDETRVALAKGDLPTAKTKSAAYAQQVAAKKVPFEVRQQHELAGRIAVAEKSWAAAVAELEQASQRDPRVLYVLATALKGKGDAARAREICKEAANFNELTVNYAYVRTRAKEMLAKS
jgi:tetratricopeptide (TPR) repeat protein